MEYSLSSALVTATISTLGAELRSLRAFGTEYLWQGDAQYWAGRSPVLFPFVGRLTGGKYRLHGREFPLEIHGFARKKDFTLEDKQDGMLCFLLEDDAESFAMYPFHFQLRIRYTLQGSRLAVAYELLNLSDENQYFGLGGHPGFNLPLDEGLDFTDYFLEFPFAHQPSRVGFTENCFLNGEYRPFPLEHGVRLPLAHSLFNEDAIVLADVAREVVLRSEKGPRGLRLRFAGLPYLGIWHAPHTAAPYVCLEPWCSLPSRQDITEDFACKSDLLSLPAGESCQRAWELELL